MKIAVALYFTITAFTMSSQRVQSSSYDLLLQRLLSHSVKEIGVQDLGTMKDVQLVDGRGPEEYRVSHIKDALFIGNKNLSGETIGQLDKNKPVVMYCSIGYRSEKIAEKLEKEGFKEVYNLYGGIFEWVNQGKPVYNSDGRTNNIHPYSWLWGQWLSTGNKTMK